MTHRVAYCFNYFPKMKESKMEKSKSLVEDSGASAVHKLVYVVLKATMGDCDVEKGIDEKASPVMEAATDSLKTMSSEVPMVVMQMWLEQFGRIHSGSSMAEYTARERVLLLRNMEQMIDPLMTSLSVADEDTVSVKACVGRLIALTTEEMTKQSEVIQNIQQPCSAIIVSMGGWYIDRVMDAIQLRLNPTQVPHIYTMLTIDGLAKNHSISSVPYLKSILEMMAANAKMVRRDNMRAAYASACRSISAAILEYLTDADKSPNSTVSKAEFYGEMDALHEHILSQWISSRVPQVKNSSLEAIGQMTWLVSTDRFLKSIVSALSSVIGALKKSTETEFATNCLLQLLLAAERIDIQVVETMVESTVVAAQKQISKELINLEGKLTALDSKSAKDLFDCCSLLIRPYSDKIINLLLAKIGSADDVAKLASLIIMTHLLETTYEHLQDHIDEIVKSVHDLVKHEEQKAQVKHAIADIIDILATRELLNGEQKGKDFLDFVLRLSADSSPDLRRVGAGLLQRLTSEVPSVQPLLWPHLMEYLLMPGCTGTVTPVLRCLNEIITKKSDVGASVKVDFGQLTHVEGPCAILARLLVLVSAPVPRKRGMHILTFMLIFAKQINKHVRPLWGKRIPLLQLYLKNQLQWKNQANEEAVLAPGWEQSQWELWLLELLDDTIKEIGLEEWNAALVTAMEKQLVLYPESEEEVEHSFLIKALGLVLKNSTSRNVVTKQLSMIEKHVGSSSYAATCQASAMAFGICSTNYMDLVLERLSVLAQQKRKSNFFSRFQDKQSGEQQHRMHNFVLVSISQVVKNGPKDKVVSLTRDIISKFILPFLKGSTDSLKLASLKSLAHLVERVRTGEIRELPHHEELLKETIECLKQGLWSVEDKQIALNAILQLIKCPPPLNETTQCSVIKASLTFVLPGLILEKVDEENSTKCANDRKETLKVLLSLIGEVITQKPLQTTLDEVFSHVEPWMKHEARNGREVALTVYKCALQALLSKSKSIKGTGFSSAPYLITCVIPRCFDCCQQVQDLSLQVLNLLMQLLAVLELERSGQDVVAIAGEANDFSGIFLVRATTTATTDSVSPSPSSNSKSNTNIQVATEISSVLARKLRQKHVVRLLIHLADCDDANSDSGGTDRVILSLVQERKREFGNHATSVMESLLCRLVNLAKEDDEYKGSDVLAAICAIIAVDFDEATQHLLSLPVFGNASHLSRQLQRLWGAVALERETAIKFLILSLRRLTMSELFAESCGSDGIFKRTAKHDVLSAAASLGRMLQEKDAKAACEEVDFSYAFVPLVTSMCCYFGIRTRKTWPENRTFPVLPLRETTKEENGDIKVEEEIGAFGLCKWALCSFLVRRDCPLVAKVTERLWEEDKEEEERGADIGSLCCLLCDIYEALINFYPHFLPSLASNLEPLLLEPLFGRRIAAAAFFRQTLCNKSLAVDADMRRDAISNLLTVVQWEKSNSEREDEDMLVLTENGNEEKENTLKSAIARKEIRRKESNSVRILCLQGLAESGEHCGGGKEGQEGCGLKSVMSAFLLSIQVDDCGPECEVNLTAIRGLHILLLTAEQHGNVDEVRQLLPEMASKVMMFVDRPKEAAAAISCFTQLSAFVSDANAALTYAKNVHDAMVSLLLHCSSKDEDIRQCSRRGLAQIFDAMLPQDKISHGMEDLIGLLLDEEVSDLDYDRAVATMSDFPEFSSMFSSYLSSAVDHFSAPKAHSRACAVRLAAALADGVGDAGAAAVDAESVCGGLAALLALDKDANVKQAAAKAIGNTFARLRIGIANEQQQNHSGID